MECPNISEMPVQTVRFSLLLLMEEILRQLIGSLVYPPISRVFKSQVVQDFFHQQYVCRQNISIAQSAWVNE